MNIKEKNNIFWKKGMTNHLGQFSSLIMLVNTFLLGIEKEIEAGF